MGPKFTDAELISAIADKMIHYGEGCTRDQLLAHFDAADLDRLAEPARAEARRRQERQTIARVPATRAA